jgi:3-methyladenine DNA glycosylase AlkD
MSQTINHIRNLHHQLEKVSNPKTKEWWERYLKSTIPFRGVGIPVIRVTIASWRESNRLNQWSVEKELELALALFQGNYSEDKLAGIIYLQEYLYRQFAWQELLPKFENLFKEKLIFDWNVCDWFCVRLLGPMIKQNKMPFAKSLAVWKDASYLWQARSALVPFTLVSADSTYYPLINSTASTLIRREERFAKTAVGWVLRDISKHSPDIIVQFLTDHLAHFTTETIRNATKYFEKVEQQRWIDKFKKSGKSGNKRAG